MNISTRARVVVTTAITGVLVLGAAGFATAALGTSTPSRVERHETDTTLDDRGADADDATTTMGTTGDVTTTGVDDHGRANDTNDDDDANDDANLDANVTTTSTGDDANDDDANDDDANDAADDNGQHGDSDDATVSTLDDHGDDATESSLDDHASGHDDGSDDSSGHDGSGHDDDSDDSGHDGGHGSDG